jgi:integrase
VSALDGDAFDSFNAELRRCQEHCGLVARPDIATTLHKQRHYSAMELIAAGVDARTVAGRLGRGGGGVTALRYYAAWVSEADQRAASMLATRMPGRPGEDVLVRRSSHPCLLIAATPTRRRTA